MKSLTVAEKSQFLSITPLFQELSSEECDQLANKVIQRDVEAGETLCHHGDIADCLYIIITGRFRIYLTDKNGAAAVNEVRRREVVGEIALLTGERRSATVLAVRDSSVLVLSRTSFEDLSEKYPNVLRAIARTQIDRLHHIQCPTREPVNRSETIAVVPAGGNLAIDGFTVRFCQTLSRLGDVLHLRSADKSTQAKIAQHSAEDWLESREESSRFVIYESDNSATPWTTSCLRQADRVIFVADASATPGLNPIEAQFAQLRNARAWPRRDLVIVHTGDTKAFAREWLAPRQVDVHHHIQKDNDEDYARIARIVTGKAIGLVLSGGGARAFAHIGVLQALDEAGPPIDVIGGTSMGALVGAWSALDFSPKQMVEISRYIFIKRGIWDFTLPFVSLIAAKRMSTSLDTVFPDVAIEDLPRRYFCITTNLSTGDVGVHESGPLLKWVIASVSIPGIAPPIIDEGQLFYDGGILNNLPVDVMTRFGVGHIIAVNVSSFFDEQLLEVQPQHCSPWRILLNRMNPFSRSIAFPGIFNILYRSATLNCLLSSVTAQNSASLLISPKVSHFGLFQWGAIDEIIEVGLLEARKQLANWLLDPGNKKIGANQNDGYKPLT